MSTAVLPCRIEPVAESRLAPAAGKTLSAVRAAVGMVPNLHRTLAHAPAALDGYVAMVGALGRGVLGPALREKIALATAAANGCAYCASAHAAIGGGLGLDGEEVARNLQGCSCDPRDQAALDLTRELIAHKGGVPDGALAAAREAGLGDAEIVEIAAHVGLNTFTNLFIELARTEIDFPPVSLGR
jgi:uncharacterized peroxidase-related enzyme